MDFQEVVLYVVLPIVGTCLMCVALSWETQRRSQIRWNNTFQIMRALSKGDDVVEDDSPDEEDIDDEDEPEDKT